MAGMQDKGQEPGKGREEQHKRRTGQDPVPHGTGQGARGKTPEELKRRPEEEMSRERDEDEMRDEER
ncbi:hypothetical protein PV721_43315 [Streptomyces sp. MB09-01]|uniref:hypothetical protein n=1 Tax=Streptomyces sp. MB09-01 TaxID=3028666 RepID=UPI0029A08C36|nr:hypothetical protein [Streptomyces sp. MB09-01]MDX3540992.1 hypothetical protein [Streptomyces sp. MB09-01]